MPKLSEEEDKIVAELSCRENIENGYKVLLLASQKYFLSLISEHFKIEIISSKNKIVKLGK